MGKTKPCLQSRYPYDFAAPPQPWEGSVYGLLQEIKLNMSYRLGAKNALKAQAAVDEVVARYAFVPDLERET